MGRGRGRFRVGVTKRALLLLAIGACDVASAQAAPDTPDAKKACVVHHEQAQVLRRTTKLTDARAALLVCSQDVCPAAVRVDCVDWLNQVNRTIPSVVVKVKADN